MKTLIEIKALIKAGSLDEALDELHAILKLEPENVEAEMLLGTCCQLKGDSMTFNAVYEDVRPQMEIRERSGEQSGAVSLWKRYKRLWLMIFASTCLLGGLANRQMRVNDLEEQLGTASSRFERIESELRRQEGAGQKSTAKVQELEASLTKTQSELQKAEKRLRDTEWSLIRNEEDLKSAESKAASAESRAQTATSELQKANRQLEIANGQLAAFRNEIKQNEERDNQDNQSYEKLREFIIRSSARSSETKLKQIRVANGFASLTNLCLEVLGRSEVRTALRRELGTAVFRLPRRNIGSLCGVDYVMLLRLSLNGDDSDDSLRRELVENLEALAIKINGEQDSLSRLVRKKGLAWKKDRMQRLCDLIPADLWLKEATWCVCSSAVSEEDAEGCLWRIDDLKHDILKLREFAETIENPSRLVIRREEEHVILAVKLENTIYEGARTKYGVPCDYGDRMPKRISAPDGALIFEVDEEAIRNEFNERRRRWGKLDAF